MAKPPLLSVDDFRQLLHCDPVTGELRWKERSAEWFPSLSAAKTWNKKHPGNLALQSQSAGGYLFGQIQKRTYMAHRVVWAICKGQNVQDGSFIDHIDGNPKNNAISNLRECTPAQNQYNSQKKKKKQAGCVVPASTSAIKGGLQVFGFTSDTSTAKKMRRRRMKRPRKNFTQSFTCRVASES